MSVILELNALVLGDGRSHVFTIEIDGSKNVSALKDAIKDKKKHAFEHIDADALNIFQVSFPVDDDLDATLKRFRPEHDPVKCVHHLSVPVKRLKGVFGDPIEEHIHVIVQPPPAVTHPTSSPDLHQNLAVNCVVFGDGSSHVFTIEIDGSKNVSALKDAIKDKKKPAFDNIPADVLQLWKVAIPVNDGFKENVGNIELEDEEALSPVVKLSKVFLFQPEDEDLHIIVRSPSTIKPRPPRTLPDPNQPSKTYRRLVKTTRDGPTPSAQAKSATYAKLQDGTNPIYDGRYVDSHIRDTLTLPAMFYHPAFAQFLDDIDNPNLDVPNSKIEATSDFIIKSSAIYSTEDERRDSFLPHFNKAIGHTFFTLSNSDKTQPDGVVPLRVASFNESSSELLADAILLSLREDKNEIGKGGCDSSIQAVLSTRRFWVQPQRDGVRNVTCCPTIALATAGPFIMAMAVVMTDKVIVQRLTDYIYTGRELDADSHCLRIAKFFYAIGRCISRLGDYYASILPSTIEPDSKHPRFFPSIASYRNETSPRSFRYIRYLEENPSCVTLLAEETDGGKFIVVKFVQRYGIAAHRLLAEAGFAPHVFYFGRVGQRDDSPSYGKYQMVIMEWINGESAADLKAQDKLSATFTTDVRVAVDLLHASNYVFGDLRHQNIMVRHDGKIKLVDFDWAGIHGQAKYPAQMNMTIQWPQGVGPQKAMLKEHDNEMLDKF